MSSKITKLERPRQKLPALIESLEDLTSSAMQSVRSRAFRPSSGIEPWQIQTPLTEAEREPLSRSAALIDAAMANADPADVAASVGMLFAAFPGQSDPNTLRGQIKLYATGVSRFPLWAVERTVQKFMSGTVDRPNHAFVPALPEFIRVIEAETRDLRFRRWEIGKALAAEVVR